MNLFQSRLFLEFAIIYDRLGVTLIERGESFYEDMMPSTVEDLEKRGRVLYCMYNNTKNFAEQ